MTQYCTTEEQAQVRTWLIEKALRKAVARITDTLKSSCVVSPHAVELMTVGQAVAAYKAGTLTDAQARHLLALFAPSVADEVVFCRDPETGTTRGLAHSQLVRLTEAEKKEGEEPGRETAGYSSLAAVRTHLETAEAIAEVRRRTFARGAYPSDRDSDLLDPAGVSIGPKQPLYPRCGFTVLASGHTREGVLWGTMTCAREILVTVSLMQEVNAWHANPGPWCLDVMSPGRISWVVHGLDEPISLVDGMLFEVKAMPGDVQKPPCESSPLHALARTVETDAHTSRPTLTGDEKAKVHALEVGLLTGVLERDRLRVQAETAGYAAEPAVQQTDPPPDSDSPHKINFREFF